jgi:hypothetical protein
MARRVQFGLGLLGAGIVYPLLVVAAFPMALSLDSRDLLAAIGLTGAPLIRTTTIVSFGIAAILGAFPVVAVYTRWVARVSPAVLGVIAIPIVVYNWIMLVTLPSQSAVPLSHVISMIGDTVLLIGAPIVLAWVLGRTSWVLPNPEFQPPSGG